MHVPEFVHFSCFIEVLLQLKKYMYGKEYHAFQFLSYRKLHSEIEDRFEDIETNTTNFMTSEM